MNETFILENIKFDNAAFFYLDAGKIKVHVNNRYKDIRHLVYIHVVDNKVVYIGETSNTFYKRMYYYCNHNGKTNIRVREYFKEQILEGKIVETYINIPQEVIISGHKIPTYIGVEQKLIDLVRPKLNRKNVLL
jgi:hypothetical protein